MSRCRRWRPGLHSKALRGFMEARRGRARQKLANCVTLAAAARSIRNNKPDETIMATSDPIKVAVLDDYQHVSLSMADWSPLDGRAKITVFNDHIADRDALLERLRPFDVVCAMRER